MTRYLLDTNIISNATKPVPSESLAVWLGEQIDRDLFIASLTLAELRRGILELPESAKRRKLTDWMDGPEGPLALFASRILPFDDPAAEVWARLMAEGKHAGQPRSGIDMIIAATALANNCIVVTDNERHFSGIPIFNPMR